MGVSVDIDSVLFEPWALGDCCIAASMLELLPENIGLCVSSKWHETLVRTLGEEQKDRILTIQSPHAYRNDAPSSGNERNRSIKNVWSARGDFRDWRLAREIFPSAKIRMSGFLSFFAWHLPVPFDLPFSLGLVKPTNRYDLWRDLLGVAKINWTQVNRISDTSSPLKISMYMGAQWRSKQYPYFKGLEEALKSAGYQVEMYAGPREILPEGVHADQVEIPIGAQISDSIRTASIIICNDSSPAHIASLLKIPCLEIARASNIDVWRAPGCVPLAAEFMPTGYGPDRNYCSDKVLNGWPQPEVVLKALDKLL